MGSPYETMSHWSGVVMDKDDSECNLPSTVDIEAIKDPSIPTPPQPPVHLRRTSASFPLTTIPSNWDILEPVHLQRTYADGSYQRPKLPIPKPVNEVHKKLPGTLSDSDDSFSSSSDEESCKSGSCSSTDSSDSDCSSSSSLSSDSASDSESNSTSSSHSSTPVQEPSLSSERLSQPAFTVREAHLERGRVKLKLAALSFKSKTSCPPTPSSPVKRVVSQTLRRNASPLAKVISVASASVAKSPRQVQQPNRPLSRTRTPAIAKHTKKTGTFQPPKPADSSTQKSPALSKALQPVKSSKKSFVTPKKNTSRRNSVLQELGPEDLVSLLPEQQQPSSAAAAASVKPPSSSECKNMDYHDSEEDDLILPIVSEAIHRMDLESQDSSSLDLRLGDVLEQPCSSILATSKPSEAASSPSFSMGLLGWGSSASSAPNSNTPSLDSSLSKEVYSQPATKGAKKSFPSKPFPAITSTSTHSLTKTARTVVAPAIGADVVPAVQHSAELDVLLRVDVHPSNVSPDSGIQSVAGSPFSTHLSASPASHLSQSSPAHALPVAPPSPSPPLRKSRSCREVSSLASGLHKDSNIVQAIQRGLNAALRLTQDGEQERKNPPRTIRNARKPEEKPEKKVKKENQRQSSATVKKKAPREPKPASERKKSDSRSSKDKKNGLVVPKNSNKTASLAVTNTNSAPSNAVPSEQPDSTLKSAMAAQLQMLLQKDKRTSLPATTPFPTRTETTTKPLPPSTASVVSPAPGVNSNSKKPAKKQKKSLDPLLIQALEAALIHLQNLRITPAPVLAPELSKPRLPSVFARRRYLPTRTSKKRKLERENVETGPEKSTTADAESLVEQHLPLKKRHHLILDNALAAAVAARERDCFPSALLSPPSAKSTPTLETKLRDKNNKKSVVVPVGDSNASKQATERTPGPAVVLTDVSSQAELKLPAEETPKESPDPKLGTSVTSVKKSRRRKSRNKTGFPTVKRKRKVKVVAALQAESELLLKERGRSVGQVASKMGTQEPATVQNCRITFALPEKRRNEAGKEAQLMRKRKRGRDRRLYKKRPKTAPYSADDEVESGDSDAPLPLDCISETPSGDETLANIRECKSRKSKAPRWRKRYLAAGLFSNTFKADEPTQSASSTAPSSQISSKLLHYDPQEHPHGLLPPPFHCERWLRRKRRDFHLPFDLWWLHTHGKLPGREPCVPSWNYRKIRTNVYYDVKPPYTNDAQACNCRRPNDGKTPGCGDDCINRLVYTECSPHLCPSADLCSNQRIQKHQWAPGVERFMTKEKGWGVWTKEPIKESHFILEYVGEVVSEREFKHRMGTIYVNDTHHYCLHLDGGLVIDGHRMGGDGRFVNHSCAPNCEIQKWCVNGLFRMALFALRDIEPYEELTYDYNFSLFNPAEGQPCKCGSTHCRGVIGGRYQRLAPPPASPALRVKPVTAKGQKRRKKSDREINPSNAVTNQDEKEEVMESVLYHAPSLQPIKPLSQSSRSFITEHRCFLIKNYEKVRIMRDKMRLTASGASALSTAATAPVTPSVAPSVHHLLTMGNTRSVKTRRLAQAEDDPHLNRITKLAPMLRELYNIVVKASNEENGILAAHFFTLPSKKKCPEYYAKIAQPMDLITIENKISAGQYSDPALFDADLKLVLDNASRFYGRNTPEGLTALQFTTTYVQAKKERAQKFRELLGPDFPLSFLAASPSEVEEDVVRCPCGLFQDEGPMVQCERCLTWQHCDCMGIDQSQITGEGSKYFCEMCSPRPVSLDIVLVPQPEQPPEGHVYYLSLTYGDLQVRQGDCVYVLRDHDTPQSRHVLWGNDTESLRGMFPTPRLPHRLPPHLAIKGLDIFQIERLWIDEKGERFVYGHHYLRPHETYHEPSRRFFSQEVLHVPLYEAVPLWAVAGRCWVLDLNTYGKGRPVDALGCEEHIYVCELRVDRTARLFTRMARPKFPTCTRPFAFENFPARLKLQRTYKPHDTPSEATKEKGGGKFKRKSMEKDKVEPVNVRSPAGASVAKSQSNKESRNSKSREKDKDKERPKRQDKGDGANVTDRPVRQVVEEGAVLSSGSREAQYGQQRSRLNNVLLRLLSRQCCKQPLDVSYILGSSRRQRKKVTPEPKR